MPQMSAIKSKNTKPEWIVRRNLHSLGFRYRIHEKRLPGKPDIVLPRFRSVILVNGCFWHGHDCHIFKPPKIRQQFWLAKIQANRERDSANLIKLTQLGWKALTIWECALVGKHKLPKHELRGVLQAWIAFDTMNAELRGRYPYCGYSPELEKEG